MLSDPAALQPRNLVLNAWSPSLAGLSRLQNRCQNMEEVLLAGMKAPAWLLRTCFATG